MPNGNLDDLWELANNIYAKGCARREDDIKRIEAMEDWLKSIERKLDRIFFGTMGTLIAVLTFLLKRALFP